MNRKLKFRSWDYNKMDYDPSITDGTDGGETSYVKVNNALQDDSYIVFMQFTGLKDKNGVDVYDGDIVLIDDDFRVVKFFEGGFVLFANNDEDAWVNGWEDLRALIWCGVVYGNIHENIELLGGQDA